MRGSALTKIWYPSKHNHFFILFSALILLSIIGPGLGAVLGDVGYLVVDASLFLALSATLWGIRFSPRVFSIALVLVMINALSLIATGINESAIAAVVSNLSAVLFLTMCALVASYDVFRRDKVDLHKVFGGLCIYFLIGIIWAFLFQLLEQIEPSSFSGLGPSSGQDMRWSMLYFSFVTFAYSGRT